MEGDAKFYLKDCFICRFCREVCKGCVEDMERLSKGIVDDGNRDLVGRKQAIECLGKYCDKPCSLQKKDIDVDPQILVNTIMFLGTELNKQLVKGK